MRRFITIAIPIVLLAASICIMQSGPFFKKPRGKEADIPQLIEQMIEYVSNGSWDNALRELDQLEESWDKIVFRIQFSSERDEINNLDTSIARIRGALEAMDKTNALMELYEADVHWDELGE